MSVAEGGRLGRASRPRARAASVVVPFPRRRALDDRLDVARFVPSGRSLLVAFALLGAAAGAFWLARTTSVFAIDRVAVEGAPPEVERAVRRALADVRGRSLLAVDLDRARSAVEALPTVRGASVDRSFPHELRVTVFAERGVAVVRQGAASWLLSSTGRVMGPLERGARPRLPRVWVGKDVPLVEAAVVTGDLRAAVDAVAPLRAARFPARVATVRSAPGALTLVLRSGLEVRLGDAADLLLKLAVARQVLPLVGPDTRYVDVSVPERPVSGTLDSPPEVEAVISTRA